MCVCVCVCVCVYHWKCKPIELTTFILWVDKE